MMRLPRHLPSILLAGSLILPSFAMTAYLRADDMGDDAAQKEETPKDAAADDAAADEKPAPKKPAVAPAAGQDAAPDKQLMSDVEDFWHYAKIARYDQAVAAAQKVLGHKDEGQAVLVAFQKVAADRKDVLDDWLLRWQGVKELQEPVTQILVMLDGIRQSVATDYKVIDQNIARLGGELRARDLATTRLRESGELAVKRMVDTLRDTKQNDLHAGIRDTLRKFGRVGLNPLVAATDMKDDVALAQIVSVLGDLGYDAAVPYVARLANNPQTPQAVKDAAKQALLKMGAGDPSKVNAADAFYDLGEKFYYGNASITPDQKFPNAFIWSWDDANGLTKKDVPPAIFGDLMAKRSAEYALKLNPDMAPAVSLWLASDYKREAEMPEAGQDQTRTAKTPPAHYYGVAAGTQYLNEALSRALRDQNAGVAFRVIRSLQEIVGQSNLFTGNAQPLIDALGSPDRLVRYEAAIAVAASLPKQSFTGQERVVPLLAEAIGQTGKGNVLVVLPSQDAVNALVDSLKSAGYGAVGGVASNAALANAQALPSVDVIILSEELGGDINQLMDQTSGNPRLARSAKLIITKTKASPYVARAGSDSLINVTQATDVEGLRPAIEQARQRSGSLPLDEKLATTYALRAASLLERLAISGGEVLDLTPAHATLLNSLDDTRPEVVKAVGNVLGFTNAADTQTSLLAKAQTEAVADDVKVSLLKSLATNAKFFGSQLNPEQVQGLQGTVSKADNLEVRSAAAEALGALNLKANQAKELILEQSTVGK